LVHVQLNVAKARSSYISSKLKFEMVAKIEQFYEVGYILGQPVRMCEASKSAIDHATHDSAAVCYGMCAE